MLWMIILWLEENICVKEVQIDKLTELTQSYEAFLGGGYDIACLNHINIIRLHPSYHK